MNTPRRLGPPYAHPPIAEAVIEFRVTAADATMETLAGLHSVIRDLYPTRHNRYHFQGSIEGGEEGVSAHAKQDHLGYQHLTSDELQIVQFDQGRFSFSRRAPYTGWEIFQAEARRLWDIYRAATRPTLITRIGVRFINRLELALPFDDLSDYLLTLPQIAPNLPQTLSAYFMRIEIPYERERALLIVQQGLTSSVKPNLVPIILDLDAIQEDQFDANDVNLWNVVEVLRHVKNSAFEGCITDKLREVIS